MEPIIIVNGLKPNTGYVVRVRAISQANFEISSDPVHVQTKSATANEYFHDHADDERTRSAGGVFPTIEPYRNGIESVAANSVATAMTREHSGSVSQKRNIPARRQSPARAADRQKDDGWSAAEAEDILKTLTDNLDKLRDETDRVGKHIDDEEDEFQKAQSKLMKSRDSLRRAVNEKESASRNLKSQVAKLEREERTATNKRSNLEKRLRQKRDEREKLQQDLTKWDQEVEELQADSKLLEAKQVAYRDEADRKISDLREQHGTIVGAHQAVEDAIRLKKFEVKQLEDERHHRDQSSNDHAPKFFTLDEDLLWQQRLNELQFQYNEAWQALEYAKRQHYEAQGMLQYWEHRRQTEPHIFAPSTTVDLLPSRRLSQRRPRAGSLRNELSPQAVAFEIGSSAPLSAGLSALSPTYPSMSTFFNIANGSVVAPINTRHRLTPSEVDQLTGGAPTSPNVGDYLPSDLLIDDIEPAKEAVVPNSPLDTNILPGLGAPQALEHANQGPSSPGSIQSRSPSVFASPRESQTNLSFYHGADGFIDSDRRSIRSTAGSGRAISLTGPNTTSRFTSLFGFSRQRGKTAGNDGPPLGSLKSAESQSFPRPDFADLDSSVSRRRGSHGGGSWTDILHKGTSSGADTTAISATRRRFNMFGSRTDTWPQTIDDENSPPRRGSTASSEVNILPRPSTETQNRFGWPISGEGAGPRHSPLTPDWGLTATNSWSRHPSRRPSVQYGSSLTLATEAAISEADDNGHLRNGSDPDLLPHRDLSRQAPIGTRPKWSANLNPKLNPSAPAFKTIFSRDKKADESEKPPKEKKEKEKKEKKGKERARDKTPAPEIVFDSLPYDTSPTDGRKSRDAYSVTTAETGSEPRDSLDRSISHTPSEAAGNANIPKETFMQRLSRKGSSSMIPFAKRSKDGKSSGGRFSKKGSRNTEVGTPDETDEEGGTLTTAMTRSFESEKAAVAGAGQGGAVTAASASGTNESRQSIDEKKRGFSFRSLTRHASRRERTPSLHESLASESLASETGDEEGSLYDDA